MPSEQIKSEQQLQQINPRTYALSGNRQSMSGGAFAQAFDSLTQVAGATVPRFTGNNVVNAAVSAAGQSRMAISGPPAGPGLNGPGDGLNPPGLNGPGTGGNNAMEQMNMQIDRMAASNAMLMSAQVRVGELTTTSTGVSSVVKQKYENLNNLARNAKVS